MQRTRSWLDKQDLGMAVPDLLHSLGPEIEDPEEGEEDCWHLPLFTDIETQKHSSSSRKSLIRDYLFHASSIEDSFFVENAGSQGLVPWSHLALELIFALLYCSSTVTSTWIGRAVLILPSIRESIPSQNLGFVDSKATVLDLTIDGRDLTIHQSPTILSSTRDGGTTGAGNLPFSSFLPNGDQFW